VIATMDGVVLYPPLFGMTVGTPSSTMATHEFVVPRSIPKTRSICVQHSYEGAIPVREGEAPIRFFYHPSQKPDTSPLYRAPLGGRR
jgi:hypothetical protein